MAGTCGAGIRASRLSRAVQPGFSLGQVLLGLGIGIAAVYVLAVLLEPSAPVRACGVCGQSGHDRRRCPYEAERVNFAHSIPRSGRCQCCGSSRYGTQRHHPRGRANVSDFLDVCLDCHVECCHGGHFQNLGYKPRNCRIAGNTSHWCS